MLKEAYEKRQGLDKVIFRNRVMEKCGWSSHVTFWRKKSGKAGFTGAELEAIKKLDKQLA